MRYLPTFIPSPEQGVWWLGPIPLRAYAFSILAGIVIAWVMSSRRWVARGGTRDSFETILAVAIGFGIVGARLYHVITDYQLYFGPGRDWYRAFFIWEGGLGIWGAIALGGVGAWWQASRRGIRFTAVADVVAPGLLVAQAVGRLGNWFNQELFGRPTTLPWGLEIDAAHRPPGFEQYATFHPTFLYEMLWNLGAMVVLLVLEKRFRLGRGKVFALYVMLYTVGRFWIEALRIDTVNHIGGFRLNNYTSVIVFVLAAAWFAWLLRNRPGTDVPIEPARADATTDPEPDAEP